MAIHATPGFGGSSFKTTLVCPGSVRMSRDKPNQTNDSAELGTAAHELAEFCLKLNVEPDELIGFVFNEKKVDQRMVEAVRVYVDFVNAKKREFMVEPFLEKKVTISSISNELFGSADCIFVNINRRSLHVYDYKHGYVPVKVFGNPQPVFYALGALDYFSLWGSIDMVEVGIIQPRYDHCDGPIRTHVYSINEIYAFWEQFKAAYIAAKDPNAPLIAGEHCEYCLAAGTCRTRVMRTLESCFHNVSESELSVDELKAIYKELPAMKWFLKMVEERILDAAKSGEIIEGKKLVQGIKRASCSDEAGFIAEAVKEGVKKEELYEQKLKSMTKCKQILPRDLVDRFFIKPPTSLQLVDLTDKRPAVSANVKPIPSATGKFKNIMEN